MLDPDLTQAAVKALAKQHWNITGAEDWPMFKFMLYFLSGLMGVMYTSAVGVLLYVWNDLKKRVASQRSDDRVACRRCSDSKEKRLEKIQDEIDSEIWPAIRSLIQK